MKTSFLTTHPTPPVLYTLIKTHKLDLTKPAQPKEFKIRPIISQCGGPADKISWLLTRILSPLLKFVPAHLTNTNDLINRIKKIDMSQVGAFASFDVEGLYTNVDNPSAIDATMEMLLEYLNKVNLQGLLPEDIYTLLTVVLDANIFKWSNNFFKQLRGLAMGLRLAPILAIIFMHKLELKALSTLLYQFYGRYIDDTLVLATNNDHLNLIFEDLNKAHPQIKFTREDPDATGIPFLNTKLNISNSKLQLGWYRKPTCKNNILHANSAHPKHMKDNVVKSLRKTAIQICNTITARNAAETLVNRIAKQNGYIGSRFPDQRGLGRYRPNTASFKVPFISDKFLQELHQLITKSGLPISLIVIPPPNLKKLLTRSRQYENQCEKENCLICEVNKPGDCKTKGTVYQLECECGEIYIGETGRPLEVRWHEHEAALKNPGAKSYCDKPLALHRSQHHANKPMPTITVKVLHHESDTKRRGILEATEIKEKKPSMNRRQEMKVTLI